MTQQEFFEQVRSESPNALAREYLNSQAPHIFSNQASYEVFRARAGTLLKEVVSVAVVGSGNWRYSLNPEKAFREFGDHSDVDVAVISPIHFHKLWEEMRRNHRQHYYALSHFGKERLRRNSQNVYSGFISPEWIPNRDPLLQYRYKQVLNNLSDSSVRFLKVKMLFFKNFDEAVDYYARGFWIAKRTIR